jgi:hypothetical protein
VVIGPDGCTDFEALRRRGAGDIAVLYAFDLMELDGNDLHSLPSSRQCSALFEEPAPHRGWRGVRSSSEPRITLTYPALDSSRDVAFLATGDGKRDVVARAQVGDRTLPAAMVRPIGRLHWFTDRAARPGGAN